MSSGSSDLNSSESTIEITIRWRRWRRRQSYTLRVDKHLPVAALKEKIAPVFGLLPEIQLLQLYDEAGHFIDVEDGRRISDYHVEDGNSLYLWHGYTEMTRRFDCWWSPPSDEESPFVFEEWPSINETAPPPTTVSAGPEQPVVTPDPLTILSQLLGCTNGRSSTNVRASVNNSQTAGARGSEGVQADSEVGRRGLTAPPASFVELIEIKIMQLNSSTKTLQVDKHVRVSELKEQVAAATRVLSEQKRLIFRGKVLEDDQLLSAYHVEDGDTLHLVLRQPTPPSSERSTDHPDSSDINNSQTAGARVRGDVQEDSDGPSRLSAVRGLAEIYRFIKQTLDEQAGVIGQLMGLLQAHLNLTDRVAWRTIESNAMELCDLLKNYAVSLLETSRKIVILPIDRLQPWVSPNRGNFSHRRRGPDNHDD